MEDKKECKTNVPVEVIVESFRVQVRVDEEGHDRDAEIR
jgi:hypothetical protein